MKYLILFISSLLFFAHAKGQGNMIYVSPKNKVEPFFQKISVASDIGMSNDFQIFSNEGEPYTLNPKMNVGVEIECPRAYFQLGFNFAEEAPEFKLGTFLLKETLVMYLSFSKQLKPYEKDPEGSFMGGFEGNFDLLKIFDKEGSESEEGKFGFLLSPFIEIGTNSKKENLFNFGFVFKPKYHFFVRS